MFRRVGIILLVFLVTGTGVYLLSLRHRELAFSAKECPFCDPAVLQRQAFYADDLVLALYTHRPVMPGHCLVIPKRHVERFERLTDAEADQICRVIKKVNAAVEKVFSTSPYLLLQKNGWEVGQSVPHIHFHYVPRKAGDGSMLKLLFKMLWADTGRPLAQKNIEKAVQELKLAIEEQT